MIGYPFALFMALLGKIDGYRWAMALIAAGTTIAFLGFRSIPRFAETARAFSDYADVIGWSGVALAIYGLIVLRFSIWSALARSYHRLRKSRD